MRASRIMKRNERTKARKEMKKKLSELRATKLELSPKQFEEKMKAIKKAYYGDVL